MIKHRRGWRPLVSAATRGSGDADTSIPDDAQQLLAEWNRQILREQFVARQRRLPIDASPPHAAPFDEIEIVSRIGQPKKSVRIR